jgi:hypothetical protein
MLVADVEAPIAQLQADDGVGDRGEAGRGMVGRSDGGETADAGVVKALGEGGGDGGRQSTEDVTDLRYDAQAEDLCSSEAIRDISAESPEGLLVIDEALVQPCSDELWRADGNALQRDAPMCGVVLQQGDTPLGCGQGGVDAADA